jgi:flagellar assembly factor FliW
MSPPRFEAAIPAIEQPQTHALDRAATEILYMTLQQTKSSCVSFIGREPFGSSLLLSRNHI